MTDFLEIAHNPRKLSSFSSRLFRTFDADRSKYIDLNEFINFINQIGIIYNTRVVPKKEEIERYYRKLDLDKNGILDQKEFEKFIKMLLIEMDKIKKKK